MFNLTRTFSNSSKHSLQIEFFNFGKENTAPQTSYVPPFPKHSVFGSTNKRWRMSNGSGVRTDCLPCNLMIDHNKCGDRYRQLKKEVKRVFRSKKKEAQIRQCEKLEKLDNLGKDLWRQLFSCLLNDNQSKTVRYHEWTCFQKVRWVWFLIRKVRYRKFFYIPTLLRLRIIESEIKGKDVSSTNKGRRQ